MRSRSLEKRSIIPDTLPGRLALAALAWGSLAALVYVRQGLTLSHYDAKAHLVVARRILDSLTPGWEQIGAVWLPLPHLLNMVPVQVDAFYRTGASGVALSVVSFAALVCGASSLVAALTGSAVGATVAAVFLALNPNLLYLQSTPMTEPLLLGLCAMGLAVLHDGLVRDERRTTRVGTFLLTLGCLTRYEAWPITAAALGVAALTIGQRRGIETALRQVAVLAAFPAVAILLFLLLSRLTVGAWFVSGGFYVPDAALQHKPVAVTTAIWWGGARLGSYALMIAGTAAAAGLVWLVVTRRKPASLLFPLTLAASAALPWTAFVQGHPFRIRYMVTLVVAAAVVTSTAVGLLGRRAVMAAVALAAAVLLQLRPFDAGAAMVREAQWDRPYSEGRRAVTACLPQPGQGDTVMVSMGSLAHYMQELSTAGFAIRDFVHEGNGRRWADALSTPRAHVGWVLVEERAEGGDMLAQRARTDPDFLAGFDRLCEGGGVALYRRR